MDSKFEKWGELPPEMRMECVKRMNFRTRKALREVSKSDKSLVESAPKYHFDRVIITTNRDFASAVFKKTGADEAENVMIEFTNNTAETLAAELFKSVSADDFKFLNKIGHLELEKCKHVALNGAKLKFIKMFAEKCENAEKVVINKTEIFNRDESLDQLIDIPAITNAKIVQMLVHYTSNPHQSVNSLIEKWGNRDAELGTTLQLYVNDPQLLSKLSNNLRDRIIYKKVNEIRLRADNESKHILMRQVKKSGDIVFISLVVIPADQKESEYEKNDQWAEELHKQQTEARQRRDMEMVSSLFSDITVEDIMGMLARMDAP